MQPIQAKRRRLRPRATLVRAAVLALSGLPALAAGPAGVSETPVLQQPLPNVPGDSLSAVVVQLAPNASAPAHHHAGFVFAYVLSGTVRSRLNDGAAIDYRPGQGWVEPPGTVHTLTANPSGTEPASLLAVFVAPTGAQLTMPGK